MFVQPLPDLLVVMVLIPGSLEVRVSVLNTSSYNLGLTTLLPDLTLSSSSEAHRLLFSGMLWMAFCICICMFTAHFSIHRMYECTIIPVCVSVC